MTLPGGVELLEPHHLSHTLALAHQWLCMYLPWLLLAAPAGRAGAKKGAKKSTDGLVAWCKQERWKNKMQARRLIVVGVGGGLGWCFFSFDLLT